MASGYTAIPDSDPSLNGDMSGMNGSSPIDVNHNSQHHGINSSTTPTMSSGNGVSAAQMSAEEQTFELRNTLLSLGALLVAGVLLAVVAILVFLFPSPYGPPGVLSNYHMVLHPRPRPIWYLEALNQTGITGQTGGSAISFPGGAGWIFGKTYGSFSDGVSVENSACIVDVDTHQPGTVKSAKFLMKNSPEEEQTGEEEEEEEEEDSKQLFVVMRREESEKKQTEETTEQQQQQQVSPVIALRSDEDPEDHHLTPGAGFFIPTTPEPLPPLPDNSSIIIGPPTPYGHMFLFYELDIDMGEGQPEEVTNGLAYAPPGQPWNFTRLTIGNADNFKWDVSSGSLVSSLDGEWLYYFALVQHPMDYSLHVGRMAIDDLPSLATTGVLSYDWWDGSGWTGSSLSTSQSLMAGLGKSVTVAWNEYLEQWMLLHSGVVSNRVYIRTSPNIEGPWSKGYLAADAVRHTKDDLVMAAALHPELSEDDGQHIPFTFTMAEGDGLPYFADITLFPKGA